MIVVLMMISEKSRIVSFLNSIEHSFDAIGAGEAIFDTGKQMVVLIPLNSRASTFLDVPKQRQLVYQSE